MVFMNQHDSMVIKRVTTFFFLKLHPLLLLLSVADGQVMVSGVVDLPILVAVDLLLVVVISTLGLTINLEDQVLLIPQVLHTGPTMMESLVLHFPMVVLEVMVCILLGELNAKFVIVMVTLPLTVLTV